MYRDTLHIRKFHCWEGFKTCQESRVRGLNESKGCALTMGCSQSEGEAMAGGREVN